MTTEQKVRAMAQMTGVAVNPTKRNGITKGIWLTAPNHCGFKTTQVLNGITSCVWAETWSQAAAQFKFIVPDPDWDLPF